MGGWIASEINAINILLNKPETLHHSMEFFFDNNRKSGDLKLWNVNLCVPFAINLMRLVRS